MPWVEINQQEYAELYQKEKENLGVYSSGTAMAGSWMGEAYFQDDYIATTWGFNTFKPLNYIRSLKEHGEWNYWKWEGPMSTEED